MRVATEKIKAAILHTDLVARSEAALYFTSPITQDSSVMDLVIQAIEKFGIDDAFKDYSFCVNLAQTKALLRWILRHESTDAFPRSLRRDLLLHVPPQFLADLADEVRNPKFLSANGRECVARHLALLEKPADKLWTELKNELARKQGDSTSGVNDSDDEFEDSLVEEESDPSVEDDELYDDENGSFEDMEFSCDTQIFFALAVHPQVPEELILEGLAEDPDEQLFNDDGQEVEDNLLGYAVELAGRRRIEAAASRLLELIELCDGDEDRAFFQEKCCHSLSQIGTDRIVRQFASVFPNFSLDTKFEALWILENNPTDESVRTTLELFATETDLAIRCKLLSAALRNFEISAISVARELILGNERRPELLETRQDLLTCCDISGEQIPELEEWRADSANDADYARQWYQDHYDGSRSELGASWDDAYGETDFNDDDEPAEFDESLMLKPKRPHVGRNDPCPCGSGKKFKKCCYGKNDFRPEQ